MMWKQVHFVMTNRYPDRLLSIPLEQVFTEDIFVDDDLGVIVVDDFEYKHYKSIEDYKRLRLGYKVLDLETDVVIIDIAEC